MKEIARESAAPMASFCYHFPGGKEELAAAAMRRGAEEAGATFAGYPPRTTSRSPRSP